MSNKSIRIQTIHSRVRNVYDPDGDLKVFHDDLVSKFRKLSVSAIKGSFNEFNRYAPFKKDGLNIVPNDVLIMVPGNDAKKAKVLNVVSAIVKNYIARGWQITF